MATKFPRLFRCLMLVTCLGMSGCERAIKPDDYTTSLHSSALLEGRVVLITVIAGWDHAMAAHEHDFVDTPLVQEALRGRDGVWLRVDLAKLTEREMSQWTNKFKNLETVGVLVYVDGETAPIIISREELTEDRVIRAIQSESQE